MIYKGLPAKPTYVDMLTGRQARPESKDINPAMTVAALIEEGGTIPAQSLAIIE
jgi:glutathione S-transferase